MDNMAFSKEISYQDPAELFKKFSSFPWAFLLDSADAFRPFDDTNRFSYIALNPFEKIKIKNKKRLETNEIINDPFLYLKNIMSQYQINHRDDLPLFQGGAVGYFSYDLCYYLEDIKFPSINENTAYADLAIGIYDTIISFDHIKKKSWIVSTGFPETSIENRSKRAKKQIETYTKSILAKEQKDENDGPKSYAISLKSPFDKNRYVNLVKKAQNYILEGDIFEVNLSHRFEGELPKSLKNKFSLYLKMRENNPSPFSAYLNFDDHQILSASPERFLSLEGNKVSTRPIKGTAPRGKSEKEDMLISQALSSSEKDRSENVMITDLLRNDLSKVCTPQSVIVKKLCGLETYPTVHHLVTVVEGTLRNELDALDLLKACFPGGSITGAPKVRAMQIIYELEPTKRGPYCGSIGYVGFNGMMDTSIVIRTLLAQSEKITYQAGGAVVLDSSPEGEYEETLTKSAAIKKTLTTE